MYYQHLCRKKQSKATEYLKDIRTPNQLTGTHPKAREATGEHQLILYWLVCKIQQWVSTSGPQKRCKELTGDPEIMTSQMNQPNLPSMSKHHPTGNRKQIEQNRNNKEKQKQCSCKNGDSCRARRTQKISCNHSDPTGIYRIPVPTLITIEYTFLVYVIHLPRQTIYWA